MQFQVKQINVKFQNKLSIIQRKHKIDVKNFMNFVSYFYFIYYTIFDSNYLNRIM